MNIAELKLEYDKSDMYGVISNMPDQIREAVKLAENFHLNIDTESVSNILFAGMGGSAIGGDLVRSILEDECKLPISVVRNYKLPMWAGESTLLLVSSYSGNTEESISAYKDAIKKRCKIICVTTGGKLQELANNDEVPVLIIPAGLPPRGAIAYSSIPWLLIFASLGIIKNRANDIESMALELEKVIKEYGNYDLEQDNLPLSVAKRAVGKIPLIYVSTGSFSVIGKRWANQIQENAKMLAYTNELPEMNHNEIMGWHLIGLSKESVLPIFIISNSYHPRVSLRFDITSKLVEEKSGEVVRINPTGDKLIIQLFSLIVMGDFISYYLSLLNNINPEPVDIINEIKEQLGVVN